MVASVCISDIELSLYRACRLCRIDADAGQPRDHLASGVGCDRLDLRARRLGSITNLTLSGFDPEIDLLGRRVDLRLGVPSTRQLGLIGDPRGLRACGVHPLA